MPIERMFKGRNFSSESAATLVRAFRGVVADLGLRTAADRERAAKIVISIAADQTILDAEALRDKAAGLMRKEPALSAGNLLGAKVARVSPPEPGRDL